MEKIVSIHIPKCGGTAFKSNLTKNIKNSNVNCYKGNFLHKDKNYDCYHGHLGFVNAKKKLPDYKFITWVRDPIKRSISYYNYAKYTRKDNFSKKFKKNNPTYIDFMKSSNSDFIISEIDSYITNINDFYFIGILEDFENELKRLYDLMGWDKKNMILNKTNVSNKSEEIILTEEDKIFIKNKLSNEYEIYNKVLKMNNNDGK
jgi:sulfotransferase famil protein